MSSNIKAHTALLITNLIYGANYSIAKEVMPEYIEPFGFILLRVIGALLLFWLFHKMFVAEKVASKDLLKLAICGVFGVAINQLLFFKGLNITTPINAAIIMTSNPIMVLLFAAFMLKEAITGKKLAGIVLGLTGAVFLIVFGKDMSFTNDPFGPNGFLQCFAFGSDNLTGNLFILINSASYGIYLVLVKPLMAKYSPLTVIKWVFFFGLLYVLPFGYGEFTKVNWVDMPFIIWMAVLFVVLATTFIAYLLNIFALKQVSPTVVSYYVYLQPLLASAIAMFFGKDELSLIKIVSVVFIFMGVYLVSSSTSAVKQQKPN
ncbi:MAG: EamA family transporter [Bacteroidota bacterium]